MKKNQTIKEGVKRKAKMLKNAEAWKMVMWTKSKSAPTKIAGVTCTLIPRFCIIRGSGSTLLCELDENEIYCFQNIKLMFAIWNKVNKQDLSTVEEMVQNSNEHFLVRYLMFYYTVIDKMIFLRWYCKAAILCLLR